MTLFSCNQRTCTEGDTVTVSAVDSGSPVVDYSSRGSFKEGGCTFRFAYTGQRADVTGTITVDDVTVAQEGGAATEDYRVSEQCR